MLETGEPPAAPQSLISEEFLENMGSELVRLCDTMEKHGLVDYQIGVWEEEIISSRSGVVGFEGSGADQDTVLTECLDLLEDNDGEDTRAGTQTEAVSPT